MALPKGIRARGGATNGASGGARGGSVRDARDVIRGREQRPPNRGSGLGPRILKTSQGLVTNKKVKAISTAQLKNRQTASKKTAVTLTNSGRPLSLGRLPSSKVAVGATIRKSAVINSNPMLQSVLCVLLPMDSRTVGDNSISNNNNNNSSSSNSSDLTNSNVLSGKSLPHTLPNDFQQQRQDVNKNSVAGQMNDPHVHDGKEGAFRQEEFDRIRLSLEDENFVDGEVDRNSVAAAAGETKLHQQDETGTDKGQREILRKKELNSVDVIEKATGDLRSANTNTGTPTIADDVDLLAQTDENSEVHVDNEQIPGGTPASSSMPDTVRSSVPKRLGNLLLKKGVNFDAAKSEFSVIVEGYERESDWEDISSDNKDLGSGLDDFKLPSTCQILKAPSGSTVYLIGTAHFSRKSQNDVRRVIRSVKPERVVVELCKQRMHILTLDEKLLLSEASKLSMTTIRETIRKMGILQGSMFLLMMQLSAHLANKLEMAPGGEFRVAYQEAERLPMCRVYLADRELNITLWRTWANLGVCQRIRIIWNLITSTEDMTIEDVERCKEKDMLEQLLGELCTDYPEMSKVILTERDHYLCRSLYDAAMVPPTPVTVVAVVGIGHQRGIIENWSRAADIDSQKLLVVPPAPLTVRITGRLLRVGMWAAVGFTVYKLMPHALKACLARGIEKGIERSFKGVTYMQKTVSNNVTL
ncbi:uncharacterized protein LOC111269589 [Varroa jacobsoni]|uniref:uncharacterized protein LOC111269589 n=1 Tax=Varroa jacobsoni TaxID=62625 RepID=UPI000BF29A77|nr:uncharacterized protein LOC111269589 [Varroa jacobsoni]